MLSSYLGITNEGLGLYLDLFALFFLALWIALIAWTYVDAKRRIEDPVLVICATALSLYPYVGTLVYAILRPPKLLREANERELEIRASMLRIKRLEEQVCPKCEHAIQPTYRRCPNCCKRVKAPCRKCGKLVDPRWSFCPYCTTLAQPVPPAHRVGPDRRHLAPSPSARTIGLPRGGRGSRLQVRARRLMRPSHRPAGGTQPDRQRSSSAPRRRIAEFASVGSAVSKRIVGWWEATWRSVRSRSALRLSERTSSVLGSFATNLRRSGGRREDSLGRRGGAFGSSRARGSAR
jgi:hypothetical protein